ncbi:N-acetylmuramoyl-L-alanine amidase [Raoultibacter timonensis]|uniref:N-acetylmuramoyl-L-alanine amidase n=1 Tax=Raoultibacter timonensis TaxID=1907662 RepID=UPI0026DC5BFD|nr:N-acetylmuramoyl-L-alanine amidase [Raoultibacter timonensis]
MKINVNGGHSRYAPGASGYLDEYAEDRAIVARLIPELRRRGCTVSDSSSEERTVDDDLEYQVRNANASGADLAVSIHLNAGGGKGTECYYFGGDAYGYQVAADMSKRVAAALGLPNRGAKDGSNLYWVRNTSMTAVLLEVCFVDSQKDAAAYNACPWDSLVGAIAAAITGNSTEGEEDMTPQEFWEWSYPDQPTPFYQLYYNTVPYIKQLLTEVTALAAAVEALAGASGADPDAVAKAVADAVERKLESLKITVDGE